MAETKKITGIIFSDLGTGASFMSLDWVQKILREKLGFSPYPATLNLRLESEQEILQWEEIRKEFRGIDLPPADASFCRARLFPVEIEGKVKGAVLLPEIQDYPKNKIEVVAPVHVKKTLEVHDGQLLTLAFSDQSTK